MYENADIRLMRERERERERGGEGGNRDDLHGLYAPYHSLLIALPPNGYRF